MSIRVCLCADTISYPEGGGHQWVYLNWALGLRAHGCHVIWLELVDPHTPAQEIQTYVAEFPVRVYVGRQAPAQEIQTYVAALRSRLNRYGLDDSSGQQHMSEFPVRELVDPHTPAQEIQQHMSEFPVRVYVGRQAPARSHGNRAPAVLTPS